MSPELKKLFTKRPDLHAIGALIEPKSRVLDLGCGDGAFLRYLTNEKKISGLGIEISQERIIDCIDNSVPVIHADLNEPLLFDDRSFDCVVLSQTLQAVERPDLLLQEMLRIGKRVIISFMNIGYWRARLQLVLSGRMPITKTLPHTWYNTPNIHLATIADFRSLCKELDITIVNENPLGNHCDLCARLMPNLFAPNCVFLLEKRQ
jgi:methionine biosynthesis protein MetW